ncbi:hypothetical protein [Nonomuraea sp. B19D2]|uniref:hypothetical protein n=1 Tax=Nonomuraea sp. B19D2 TaxID=3159561 RepID=UPI0032DB59C1
MTEVGAESLAEMLDDEERAAIEVPRAWLTRVAGSICLELLASAAPIHAPGDTSQPGTTTAPLLSGTSQPGTAAALQAVLATDAIVVSDGGGKLRPP